MRRLTTARWFLPLVLVAVIATGLLLWQYAIKPAIFTTLVCDEWIVELKDGTVLFAPGYTPERASESFGPCWQLPPGAELAEP
jgi:hypothetical protein